MSKNNSNKSTIPTKSVEVEQTVNKPAEPENVTEVVEETSTETEISESEDSHVNEEEVVAETATEEHQEAEEEQKQPNEPVKEQPAIDTNGDGIIDEKDTGSLVNSELNPAAEPSETEVDPLPEVDGHFYIKLGEDLSDKKLAIVHERLANANLSCIETATGAILVGSYVTKEEAIAVRKQIIGKGLRGTIIEM